VKTKYISALISAAIITFLIAFGSLAQWGSREEDNSRLTVFAVIDNRNDETGFGAALTKSTDDGGQTDITYIDFESYRLVQATQLSPRQFGMFTTNLGFTIAYANRNTDATDSPDGILTGLSVTLAEKDLAFGLSLDIRASALSKGVDPISWVANPDILWFGAGLSYRF